MMRQRRYTTLLAWMQTVCLLGLFWAAGAAQAVTYANTSNTFAWIDASSHTKIGYNTTPIKFNALSGCGTTPPIIDDTMSDPIPIGFTFMYAGMNFTTLRVMTNGRVHFKDGGTCGYGSPVQSNPYPDTGLNYTMRIYGNDLDPTSKSDLSTYNTKCISKATCYVSYATVGVAPYRSFVVTWNNVPEWTTGANPVGSYSLQLILQENGEFVYQYGDDVAGPSATLGQIGWQVDSNDYDTPKAGFPPSSTAIKFYIPRPVFEYRMEQTVWGSGTGQVIDTSGNGRSGTVLGAPTTIPNGIVCRAASIPLNVSAATVDAIDTGTPVSTAMGGAGMITFWYKANSAWSSSLDAQLFDATVVAGQTFSLTRSKGMLRFALTDSTGAVRTVQTSAIAVAAGTWKHIAVSWNFNALIAANSDHIRIYVDGVQVKESAFTSAGTISQQLGTLYIGDARSTVADANVSGNSADGGIDEVRAYNYEGGLALVQRDQNVRYAGCLNHYAVSNAGTALTCQQTTVTITAHDLNHATYTMPNNTTSIRLSTSTGVGDWTLVNGYGVLDNGIAGDGIATYLFNGEYQGVFALSNLGAGTVSVDVTDGQFTESSTEDPALTVKMCVAARFNACEYNLPAIAHCVPSSNLAYAKLNTKLAGSTFTLDLVKLKTDATLESTFNGPATVELLLNSVSGVPIDANNCPGSYTASIPLGTTTFTGGYTPSGITITAAAISAVAPKYSAYQEARIRVTCTAASCGTANTACSTDSFAIRPKDLVLTAQTMNNVTQKDDPKLKAGAPFTMTATAIPGYNGTPKIENALAKQKVLNHNGVVSGSLGNMAGNSPVPFSAAPVGTGVSTSATIRFDDLGNFKILAGGVFDSSYTSVDQPGGCIADSSSNTPDSSGKFGCNIGSQNDTPLFGRFFPDHYDVNATLIGACNNTFTYMGQPELGIALSTTAYTSGNVIMTGYSDGYGTIATVEVTGDNGGTALDRLTPALPAFTWSAGLAGRNYRSDAKGYSSGATSIGLLGSGVIAAGAVLRFNGDPNKYVVTGGINAAGNVIIAAPGLLLPIPAVVTPLTVLHSFSRKINPSVPDGPYDNFGLRATVNDKDGALIANVNGVAVAPASSIVFGSTKVRYGRMRIDNAYGSELLPLPFGMTAQYWNNGFITNTLDNCTSVSATTLGTTGALAASTSLVVPKAALFVGGIGKNYKLEKPSTALTSKASVTLTVKGELDAYLPGFGTETFGTFKSGPVIYVREIY